MMKFRDVKRAMDGPRGPATLDLIIEVEDEGKIVEVPFHYVPDDPWPVTLAVKAWLAEHADFPIGRRPPVTPETFSLSRYNLRRALIAMGLRADATEQAFDAAPYSTENELLRAQFLDAPGGFVRSSPVVALVLKHYAIDEKKFDAEWVRLAKIAWGLD